MRNPFQPESKVMQLGNQLASLMVLQALVLLFSLPLLTAGAAFTAMHYVALRICRKEDTSVWKDFWHSFKSNFKQSTIIWVIYVFVLLFLLFDFNLILASSSPYLKVVISILLISTVFVLLSMCWVFPLQSRYDNSTARTIKNAIVMVFTHPLKSAIMLILFFGPAVLGLAFYQILPIVFFLGFSFPAFVCAHLYSHIFDRMENANQQDTQSI